MPAQIVTCQQCNSRYQTTAPPGQRLQCPACKATLFIPAPLGAPSLSHDPLGSLGANDIWAGLPPAGANFAPPGRLAGTPSGPMRPRSTQEFTLDPELVPFLKRLGLGIGIACALIVVTAIGGFYSEPVAMAATIIGLVAALGLAFAGRIWFVVIAFQKSALLGAATIFVPLLWMYCLANRIGRSQLAFALLVSALIPTLLSLCLAVTFTARYTPQGQAAARAGRFAENADKMVKMIREHESKKPPTGEPREATYSYVMQIDDPAGFISEGERGLSQFSGYVKGSLRVDEKWRRISFQHRGSDDLELKYKLYLAFKTNVIIGSRFTAK